MHDHRDLKTVDRKWISPAISFVGKKRGIYANSSHRIEGTSKDEVTLGMLEHITTTYPNPVKPKSRTILKYRSVFIGVQDFERCRETLRATAKTASTYF